MKRVARWVGLIAPWVGAAVVIWWSVDRGRALQRQQPAVKLGAAPLVGRSFSDGWDWRFGWGLVAAGVIAALVSVGCWRGWWFTVRLRWVMLASALGATLFATTLALTDGVDGLLYGARHETEYLANLKIAPPAGEFVRTFVDRIDMYSVHVRGHPPGFLLVLKFLDAVGLHGAWPVAMLSVVATGVLAAAVLAAVRATAGDEWMRRCAPFLIVAPYAIWMVTSADAVYTAVGALGIAAAAEGLRRTGWLSAILGLFSGALLGSLLYLTYLGAVLVIIPAVLVVAALIRREPGAVRTAAAAVAAAVAVVGGFWVAGFWWFDGVSRTKGEYLDGSAQFRVWSYFAVGNIGAALFAIGPATLAGLTILRSKRMWLLVGAAIAALAVSHFSQYTKAEVERIWLLFYPWIAIAGAGLVGRSRWRWSAGWVAVQASCAIVLQAALVSKW